MALTMKAVVFEGGPSGVHIASLPVPTPGKGDLLVQIKAASLCASDLLLLDSPKTFTGEATIPGHEATGVVSSVGEGVTGFAVGDEVGFLLFYHYCDSCAGCAVNPSACTRGGKMQGFSAHGYFAEYSLVDFRAAMKLPRGMDVVSAAPLFCAGVTAFHAVEAGGVGKGEWIGVVGVGGLGHLAVQYAAKMGLRVVALDVDSNRLDHATGIGAELTFNTSDPEWVSKLKDATGGGCKAACVFSAAVPAYDSAVQSLAMGGTLVCVGLPKGKISFAATPLAMGYFHVKGASQGKPSEMGRCIEFSHEHGIKPQCTRFGIEEFPEMVAMMREGRFQGRMVVTF